MTLLPEQHNGWQREQKCSRDAILNKFMDRVSPEPMSGCWLWLGQLNGGGYGKLSISNKHILAHRLSYHLFVDDSFPVSGGDLSACHKCDTPSCVNPAHIFPGTHRDNLLDAAHKGRLNKPTPAYCKHGHQLDAANSYRYNDPQGREHVKCRACNRIKHKTAYWESA